MERPDIRKNLKDLIKGRKKIKEQEEMFTNASTVCLVGRDHLTPSA